MIKLAPSLLAADFCRLGEQLAAIERAGARYAHIDVMDGHFVPNLSMGVPVVKSLRKCSGLVFDVHLMISEPEKYIGPFAEAGADIICFHAEAAREPEKLIGMIIEAGALPAMAVKPGTEISAVFPYLDRLRMVLIMSVEPGFGGQKFMPSALEKARALKSYISENSLNADIEMDGGIDLSNAGDVVSSGVNVLVAGSAIFGAAEVEDAARAFLERFK